jgi:integrase
MYLSQAIDTYLAYRQATGIKQSTLRGEKYTLRLLLADTGNINMRQLAQRHIDHFFSKRTTWGPGSMNRGRYHLNSFIKWAQVRKHVPQDSLVLDDTRPQRVPPRDRIIIPHQNFSTFLAEIRDPRTRAMCAIGLYLFTRISETRVLRWQDVDLDNGKVTVRREKISTIDVLPLCDELKEELLRWRLEYAKRLGRPVLPGDQVIPYQKQGKRMGVKGKKGVFELVTETTYEPHRKAPLGGSIRQALTDAGYYQKYEGGHTLRRSGAVALYNSLAERGHDRAMRTVQWMLGHSSIQTTEIYLRLDLESKAAMDLLSGKQMFPEQKEAQLVEIAR